MKLFYLNIIIFLLVPQLNCKLEFLIEVLRHGAKQGTTHKIWTAGDFPQEDALTPIGIREQYNLGVNIRDYYINEQNFIPPQYDNFNLHVRSTYEDRTLQSVVAQLAGLFPFGTGPNLPVGINRTLTFPPFKNYSIVDPEFLASNAALPENFQPICVHTLLEEQDLLFEGYKGSVCPGVEDMKKQLESTPLYQATLVLPTCQAVAPKFNYSKKMSKFSDCTKLMDVVEQEKYANWALPQLNETEWKVMNFAKNIDVYLSHFQDTYSISFAATPMLQLIIDMFNNRITGKTKKKFEIFSVHHEQVSFFLSYFFALLKVAFVLAALNMSSCQCMQEIFVYNKTSQLNCIQELPFASNLFIELYSNDTQNNSYYVKLRFNGNYYYVCEKESYTCEYNEFIGRLQGGILLNWTLICGSNYSINPFDYEEDQKFYNFYDFLDSLSYSNKKEEMSQSESEIEQIEELKQYLIVDEQSELEKDKKWENENEKRYTENQIMNIFILGQFILVFVLAGYYYSQKVNNQN